MVSSLVLVCIVVAIISAQTLSLGHSLALDESVDEQTNDLTPTELDTYLDAVDSSRTDGIWTPQDATSGVRPSPLARLGRLRALLRRYFPADADTATANDEPVLRFEAGNGTPMGPSRGAGKQLRMQLRSGAAPISSAQLADLLEQVALNKQQRAQQVQAQQQQPAGSTIGHKTIRNVQPVVMRLPPRFGRRLSEPIAASVLAAAAAQRSGRSIDKSQQQRQQQQQQQQPTTTMQPVSGSPEQANLCAASSDN